MPRAIIHVDMDAFYASVEQRDAPELRGKPVIVGGHPTRGVVLAASYEVRPFGVRSAMPMSRAMKQAPHAIVVPPRFHAYADASEAVFNIFESVTPLVEPLSLDEAFLDVTGSLSLFGTASQIAAQIRARIAHEVSLPASAGIAEIKFVAKIASDLAKPNGQREVAPGEAKAFLSALPVSRLWGVGPKTEETLRRLKLNTIGDVAACSLEQLGKLLGSGAQHFWELSHAIDTREVVPDRGAKSIGAEDTFEDDLADRVELHPHLHSQALRVGRRLRRAGVTTRVVQLKIKFADFELITRRSTLDVPTDDGQTLYREALGLLERIPRGRAVRLTGVSAQDLDHQDGQLPLFAATPSSSQRLNAALDRIVDKFGAKAIVTADLVKEEVDDEDRARIGASRLDAARAKPRR